MATTQAMLLYKFPLKCITPAVAYGALVQLKRDISDAVVARAARILAGRQSERPVDSRKSLSGTDARKLAPSVTVPPRR